MSDNPRDLIEQASRWLEFDESDYSESALWVRSTEAQASIAISLKRIADFICEVRDEDRSRKSGKPGDPPGVPM